MTDLENILPLWHELEAAGSDYVLATVVDVDGPSYRKPGARMLIAADGRRAGTVSGGCLEAEVAQARILAHRVGPRGAAVLYGGKMMATCHTVPVVAASYTSSWSGVRRLSLC